MNRQNGAERAVFSQNAERRKAQKGTEREVIGHFPLGGSRLGQGTNGNGPRFDTSAPVPSVQPRRGAFAPVSTQANAIHNHINVCTAPKKRHITVFTIYPYIV